MHQLTDNVKLLQKAVLIHQGKFLILKRSGDSAHRGGKWDLPGGNSEWPESQEPIRHPHQGDMVREIQEETGIILDPNLVTSENLCYFGTYFAVSEFYGGKAVYTIIAGWKVELPGEFDPLQVQISHEHSAYAWISPEEFNQYDFGFAGEESGFIRGMVEGSFREKK